MPERDLYSILGVSRGASDAEIKRAYRKLAHELHPDRNPQDKRAEERFKEVSRAYQVLSNPKKRKLYDEFGHKALQEGFDPQAYRRWQRGGAGRRGRSAGVDDIFGGQPGTGGGFGFGGVEDLEDLFGGLGGSRGRARRAKGTDVESEVTVEFTEALRGCEKQVSYTIPGVPNGYRNVRARIPRGVEDGDKVRLRGQGAPASRGGRPGDLVLTVRVRPHSHFWREGHDLHLALPVTPGEAYRGAKVSVPTPEGQVTVSVPARTQSGARLRLRGKGVTRSGETGNLICHIQIQLPTDAESQQVESLLDSVDAQFERNPRSDLEL